MTYAKRTDANQRDIVKALRETFNWVQDLSKVGGGCPDILVWSMRYRKYLLMEIKTEGGNLNKQQREYHARCPEVHVVRSVDEALRLVGAL